MAEIVKLLEINGGFKSDLMLNFLSSSNYKRDTSLTSGSLQMTDAVESSSFLHSNINLNIRPMTLSSQSYVDDSPNTQSATSFPSRPETSADSTTNVNTFDNQTYACPDVNLNGNTVYEPSAQLMKDNMQCPRIMSTSNLNTSVTTNLNELNKSNQSSPGSRLNVNVNNVDNANIGSTTDDTKNMNVNANAVSPRQETISFQKLEPNGARPTVPDTNANNTIDVGPILAEVHEKLSDSRQMLIDQVTVAIIDAHMNTTINTTNNVSAAKERIEREANEMPDMSSLSMSGSNLWQRFMGAMVPEITKVINFSAKLPGFPELEKEDKICLIKQGCFEVMVARFCILVDEVKEEMFDPTLTVKAPRCLVKEMPMGPFLDQFFTVAGQFNPLHLSDDEIGLFTAILMICPEREGLKNQAAVEVLQQLFIQALYMLLKQNHQDADKTLTLLVNMVPVFHKINEDHLKFLKMIKMKSPAEFEKKFPPLHKELFDTC